jgi:hypothetical protein
MKLTYGSAIASIFVLMSSTAAIAAPAPLLTMEAKLVPADKAKSDRPQSDTGDAAVECVVKNVSHQTISIVIDEDDYENWGTNNESVRKPLISYGARLPILARSLAPGKTYSRIVPIHFMKMKGGKKVTFKMVFGTNPFHFFGSNGAPAPAAYNSPSIVITSAPITATVPNNTSNNGAA